MLIELDKNGLNANANKHGDDVNLHDRINEAYNGELGEKFQAKTKKRVDWVVDQVTGKTVLDVGCSQGIVPLLLAQKGVSVLGVDIDKKVVDDALAALKKENKQAQRLVNFIEADFLEYEAPHDRFDSVIFSEFLEHLYDPEEFIARAHKLTKNNGRLIITVPFGINDHPDHRQNFYLNELFGMVSKYYKVTSVQIIEKWIGFVGEKHAAITKPQAPLLEYSNMAEEAFYRIERSLTDNVQEKKQKLVERNEKLKTLQQSHKESVAMAVEYKQKALRFLQQRNQYRDSLQYRVGSIITYPVRRVFRIPLVQRAYRFGYFVAFPSKKRVLEGNDLTFGQLHIPPPPQVFEAPSLKSGDLRNLRVAAITDDFTDHAFGNECTILQLTPTNWKNEITKFKPHMLFVESAWRGKDGAWRRQVSHETEELEKLVRHCQKSHIPTVFWNKEDPAHTALFLPAASLFDFVFTTDIDCIPVYRDVLVHGRIGVLPFAAQPTINNPIEKYYREDKISFAGSFYEKYKERSANLVSLITELKKLKDVDIFDRNFGKGLGSKYEFPKSLKSFVRGSLAYDEIDKAYKGYHYAININTVKYSPTMFARRVYELLASNTVTISNFSKGIKNILGDTVVLADDGKEAVKQLKKLVKSDTELRRFKLRGLRLVMQHHTYNERLEELCRVVFSGFSPQPKTPGVLVVASVNNKEQAQSVTKMFKDQTLANKRLLLVWSDKTPADTSSEDVRNMTMSQAKNTTIGTYAEGIEYISLWHLDNYYGNNFLTDMLLATQYADNDIVGKASYYKLEGKKLRLVNPKLQYQANQNLLATASLFKKQPIAKTSIVDALNRAIDKQPGAVGQGLDEFEFCQNGAQKLSQSQLGEITVPSASGIELGKLYARASHLSRDSVALKRARLKKLLRIRRTLPFIKQL